MTYLPRRIGKKHGGQDEIIKKISEADIVIADISKDNSNTLVVAGIALGASRKIYLVAEGAPHTPTPFMVRHKEVLPYSSDIDLLGVVHQIVYRYRRRVLNYEIAGHSLLAVADLDANELVDRK